MVSSPSYLKKFYMDALFNTCNIRLNSLKDCIASYEIYDTIMFSKIESNFLSNTYLEKVTRLSLSSPWLSSQSQ